MGKINDVLQRYLSDRERFADLFNAAYFHGNQVVRYTDLKEENALYKAGQQQRDIKMCMQTGCCPSIHSACIMVRKNGMARAH